MEQSFSDGSDPKGEEFRTDALGNRTYSEKTNFSFSYEANPARRQNRYDADFRLEETYAVTASGARDELGYWESTGYTYSMPGHLRFKGYIRVPHVEGQTAQWWQEASYYQADGKLAVFERHDGDGSQEFFEGFTTGRGLREEYRSTPSAGACMGAARGGLHGHRLREHGAPRHAKHRRATVVRQMITSAFSRGTALLDGRECACVPR